MADAPAPPSALSPAPAGEVGRSSSSSSAPRQLPSTMTLPPPPASRSRGARRPTAAGSGGRGGKRKAVAPVSAHGSVGSATDRLAVAVRVVGSDVDPGVAGADILQLAMAKGPMFAWLSYWPEQGYPKEDHPY